MDGGAGLPELLGTLKCGTFCGACLPEIKRMVAESPDSVAVTA